MLLEAEEKLKKLALKLRFLIIDSIYSAKSGHPGSSLSCLDLLLYLYKNVLIDCKNFNNVYRDRFILSKGHAAPALYAVLAELNFFSFNELKNLRKIGHFLQGHPNMHLIKGVEMSSGSLGQGASIACGMALGLKLSGAKSRVFCMLGDGELQEGQVFEAFCFAAHKKLSNLCFIIDNNGLQIDGKIEDVAGFKNIKEKLEAFSLNVIEIDGHDFSQMEEAFNFFEKSKVPVAIVAKTVKGKGISFMENKAEWHGKSLNDEEYLKAIEELK